MGARVRVLLGERHGVAFVQQATAFKHSVGVVFGNVSQRKARFYFYAFAFLAQTPTVKLTGVTTRYLGDYR